MTIYMVMTGDGNELCNGLQSEQAARAAAQTHADNLRETVYYCEARAGAAEIAVQPTLFLEFIDNVDDYIIIDDGAFRYIMDRGSLAGTSEQTLRSMSADEYNAWCQDHPCNDSYATVGSGRLVELCNAMISAGAEVWHIARQ